MNRNNLKRLAMITLGGAVMVGVLVGTAAAKPNARAKVQQVVQPFQLPPQATNFGIADATATCADGTSLVGGGALLNPGTPLPSNVELFKSGLLANSWSVRYNNNEAIALFASVHAICLPKKLKVTGAEGKPKASAKVRQVVQPLQLPPQAVNNGIAEADANCPGNSILVGGGAFSASTLPNLRVTLFESGPRGNAWHVRYDNDDVISQPATITAVCLKNKLKVKGGEGKALARSRVQQVTQQVQLPPQAINSGVAEFNVGCPGKTTVVDGGGLFSPGAPLATTAIELFESGPQGNGWHVRFNNDAAVNQTASIAALCLRKKLTVK
jgi:hypothetical protein